MSKRRPPRPALPSFPSSVLAEVNRMDRSASPLEVAAAALRQHAATRGPVPDYHAMLAADRLADVVLAALHRRGMLA